MRDMSGEGVGGERVVGVYRDLLSVVVGISNDILRAVIEVFRGTLRVVVGISSDILTVVVGAFRATLRVVAEVCRASEGLLLPPLVVITILLCPPSCAVSLAVEGETPAMLELEDGEMTAGPLEIEGVEVIT